MRKRRLVKLGKKSRKRMTGLTEEQRAKRSEERKQKEKEMARRIREVQHKLLVKLLTEPEARQQIIKIMREHQNGINIKD